MGGDMNFSERFKEICDEIKKTLPDKKEIESLDHVPARPRIKYNIHKRSLPIGIDKVVMVGLTREEADWIINRKLKAKIVNTEQGINQVIYYEAIQEDGTLGGIFENPSQVIKEDIWIN
jgi:hypothetical protein